MVLSYYLYNYPYKICWSLVNIFRGKKIISFYCADPLDYEMFLPIKKYLPDTHIIAKNKKTRKYLSERNIKYKRMPSFPNVVIMARQTPYKFPVKKIKRFGFDHGLYQFKRWTDKRNYNDFNIYFVSSDDQVQTSRKLGINTTKAIGYPKLDNAFNGFYDEKSLSDIKKKCKIDERKKIILFTTTWDVAGLSAIDKWINALDRLSVEYNVFVTVHTWIKQKYKELLRANKNITFIEDHNTTPYLMLSDILIGDYSSIIGEFCAFDKPIITFKVPESDRTIPEIITLIKSISLQVDNEDELFNAIKKCLKNPQEKSDARRKANKLLFYKLDGKAGERAASEIKKFM